ncbi:MAG: hypothetical protein GX115_01410 [Ruminiclostridium sp.]|nr:hypothetical protein [Ruminiclostridium sp.]
MAFAVKNGTIKGTSLNTLSPKTEIDGKMFASIILRLLGEVTPADSYQKGIDILSDKGIVSRKDVDYFKKCPFTKDQIVGMTYSALFAPFSNSNETLLDKLVHEGIIPTEDVILKRKVKQIIQEIITPNMTILEKEYAIYNYVINNVMYDYSFKKNTDYHALVEGVSVCQGYALATKLLFDEAGFESRVIFSTDHAWNLVKIGDSYYHLDSTGRKFNKNDDYVGSYQNWNKSSYPECNGTNAAPLGFLFVKGDYYYYDNFLTTDSAQLTLFRKRLGGPEEEVCKLEPEGWVIRNVDDWVYYATRSNGEIYRKNINDTEHHETIKYKNIFLEDFIVVDGWIYISNTKNLVRLNIDINEQYSMLVLDDKDLGDSKAGEEYTSLGKVIAAKDGLRFLITTNRVMDEGNAVSIKYDYYRMNYDGTEQTLLYSQKVEESS